MVYDKLSNAFAEGIIRTTGGTLLDANNIIWKVVKDKWLGKRSVLTSDNRDCWLEDTETDNVKLWRCGKDADYNEIFYR